MSINGYYWLCGWLKAKEAPNEAFNALLTLKPCEDAVDAPPSAIAIPIVVPDMSVYDLELSVRSLNCLKNEGIETVAQLVEKTESEMLHTPNYGRKSLNELKIELAKLGLTLKGGKIPDPLVSLCNKTRQYRTCNENMVPEIKHLQAQGMSAKQIREAMTTRMPWQEKPSKITIRSIMESEYYKDWGQRFNK